MVSIGKPVQLADVARMAGVGTSSASRVINGDPTVSVRAETRDRILEAARKLDYRPNALARGLRLSRTMTLGVVVNLSYYHENAKVLGAAERAAAAAGFATLISDSVDFAVGGEAYRRLVLERRADGLLIASLLPDKRLIQALRAEGPPFVVINQRHRAATSVSVDDALGISVAVEHLTGLGHQRIGYVAGLGRIDPWSRRLSGFRESMRARELVVPAGAVISSPTDDDSVFTATLRLLERQPRLTAIVAFSPAAGLVALAAAKRSGFRVPEDLSIVAYSDSSIAEYTVPSLTTVRMSFAEMARRGIASLLQLIAGGRAASEVVPTPPALVERASTAPPREG